MTGRCRVGGQFQRWGNRAFIGRSAAGPLLFELLAALVPDRGWTVEDSVFSRLNLRQIDVCAATGELPGRYCPAHEEKRVHSRRVAHPGLHGPPGGSRGGRHGPAGLPAHVPGRTQMRGVRILAFGPAVHFPHGGNLPEGAAAF
jgi:hypothetical protein